MNQLNQSLTSKIQKLFALAGNNPNPQEAYAAMAKAQSLMAENGLVMSDLNSSTQTSPSEEVVEMTGGEQGRDGKMATWWHKSIARTIAKNYRCEFYLGNRRGNGYVVTLVGLESDVALAIAVYRFAVTQAAKNADNYIRSAKLRTAQWNNSVSRRTRNDYLLGWTNGLKDALDKNRANLQEKALVIVTPHAVTKYMGGLGLSKVKSSSIAIAGSATARNAGYQAGSKFRPGHNALK